MLENEQNLRFVIVSPRNTKGGTIVLHALCKSMNELGYDARIFYTDYFGGKKVHKFHFLFYIKWLQFVFIDLYKSLLSKIDSSSTSDYSGFRDSFMAGCKRKHLPFVSKKTVVIYPDLAYGNILKAKRVVRYMLYYNRFKGESSAYGKNDLFIAYRKEFNDLALNPHQFVVTVSYTDTELYKRMNYGSREGKCYIIRKGKVRSDIPEVFDGIVIDDLPEREKVEAFNRCEWCISYDTQTYYSTIAAICGCKSVVVPEPGKDLDSYLNENNPRYGVSIGFSDTELQRASNTIDIAINRHLLVNRNSIEETNRFIDICEEFFYGKKLHGDITDE